MIQEIPWDLNRELTFVDTSSPLNVKLVENLEYQ